MKFPVPDQEAQAKAEKTIKEIFKDEYAKKKPAEKIELANKLLQQGAETNDDPAAKYILFREARDLASKSGDVALALKAVDELVMQFELSPVEEKFTTLDVLERASTTSAANKSIFEVMMAFVEERLRADDYDLAMKSLKIAQSAAAKTRIAANVAIVSTRIKEMDSIRKANDRVKQDRATLKDMPDDPAANMSVGKFVCFFKGDWMMGLPMLAKGLDPKIQSLAKQDLSAPTMSAAQLELGNAWWDFGEGLDKAEQTAIRLRAIYWYKQAQTELTGLTKIRIEKRITDMDKKVPSGTNEPEVASNWIVLFRSSDPSIWNTESKKTKNRFALKLSRRSRRT